MISGQRITRALATCGAAVALATGGSLLAAAPATAQSPYQVLGVYSYSSLSQCSQAMDRYAQRYRIIQGCTVVAWVNNRPNAWRLMIGR